MCSKWALRHQYVAYKSNGKGLCRDNTCQQHNPRAQPNSPDEDQKVCVLEFVQNLIDPEPF